MNDNVISLDGARAKKPPQQVDATAVEHAALVDKLPTCMKLGRLKPPMWAFDDYPPAAGYVNAYRNGELCGRAVMKYLREEKPENTPHFLQWIAVRFALDLRDAKNDAEIERAQGRLVGLFSYLNDWLMLGARLGASADVKTTWLQTRADLQDVVGGGPERRFRESYEAPRKAARSERARKAANARWSRVKR